MDQNAPGAPERDPRVYLAAERTFLAWIRTGLAMMGFGFVVARFGIFLHEVQQSQGAGGPNPRGSLWFGVALVLMGVAVNVLAAVHHVRLFAHFRKGDATVDQPSRLGIAVSLALAAAGISVAAYLLLRT